MVFRLIQKTEGFSGCFRGLTAMFWRYEYNHLAFNSIDDNIELYIFFALQ